MRSILAFVLIALSTVTLAAVNLKSDTDKLNYTIGVDLGSSFKQQKIELEQEAFMQGINDGYSGKKPRLSTEQMKQVMINLQKRLIAEHNKEMGQLSKANADKGKKFRDSNKSKSGVVTLKDDLQYRVIKQGKGNKPSKADTVTVEYTGKLVDGTVFDSTEKAGKAQTFKVGEVIPGWVEVLQLMPEGSEFEVVIPPKLGYGEHGAAPLIGPNETLIFNIKLVKIDKS